MTGSPSYDERVAIEVAISRRGVLYAMRKFGLTYETAQAVKIGMRDGVPSNTQAAKVAHQAALKLAHDGEPISPTPTCNVVDPDVQLEGTPLSRCNRPPHHGNRHRESQGTRVIAEWTTYMDEQNDGRVWPTSKPKRRSNGR